MGLMNAIGMAEAVADGQAGLESAIEWHLRRNHYPPVPNVMVPVALDAIAAAEDEDYGRHITLPDDVAWRGMSTAPAWAIVEHLHLEPFIERGF